MTKVCLLAKHRTIRPCTPRSPSGSIELLALYWSVCFQWYYSAVNKRSLHTQGKKVVICICNLYADLSSCWEDVKFIVKISYIQQRTTWHIQNRLRPYTNSQNFAAATDLVIHMIGIDDVDDRKRLHLYCIRFSHIYLYRCMHIPWASRCSRCHSRYLVKTQLSVVLRSVLGKDRTELIKAWTPRVMNSLFENLSWVVSVYSVVNCVVYSGEWGKIWRSTRGRFDYENPCNSKPSS